MGGEDRPKLLAAGTLLVLLAASAALTATAAPAPRVLRFACATGPDKTLHYVAWPSRCRRGQLVDFEHSYRLMVCARARRSWLATAGQPCARPLVLPAARRTWFCVSKRKTTLRPV